MTTLEKLFQDQVRETLLKEIISSMISSGKKQDYLGRMVWRDIGFF